MKYTNKHNIPDEVIRALKNDNYSKGDADISATGLLQPPQIRILNNEHEDEITTDVSDRIWILLGTSVHNILEKANEGNPDVLTEQRIYATVDGFKISGQTDTISLKEKILKDFKVTSAWSVISARKDGKPEWAQQLNIYAWLYKQNNDEDIKQLQIIAICRDWNKNQMLRSGGDYPKSPVAVIPVNLWTEEEQLEFIRERIQLHKQSDLMFEFNGTIPPCTAQERWKKPDKYRILRKGRKSALRLLPTMEDAKAYIENQDEISNLSIEFAKGESLRCKNYCDVAPFCNQYKQEMRND